MSVCLRFATYCLHLFKPIVLKRPWGGHIVMLVIIYVLILITHNLISINATINSFNSFNCIVYITIIIFFFFLLLLF